MERFPFTRRFLREHDQYVAICEELDVATCADSLAEAFAALDEAMDLYLETLNEDGRLEFVLGTRGLRLAGECR